MSSSSVRNFNFDISHFGPSNAYPQASMEPLAVINARRKVSEAAVAFTAAKDHERDEARRLLDAAVAECTAAILTNK